MLSVSRDQSQNLEDRHGAQVRFSRHLSTRAILLYNSHYTAFFGVVRCKSTACEIYGAVPAPTLLSKDFFFSSSSLERRSRYLGSKRGEHRAGELQEYDPDESCLALPACIITENRYVRTLRGWTRNRNGVTLQRSRKISERPLCGCVYAMQLTATSISDEYNCRAVNHAPRRDACVIRDSLSFNSRV